MKNTQTNNEQELLEKTIASQINIPPQPIILLEIDKLLNKANSPLPKIGDLINKDVGLSGAIFKIVNSSFYHTPTKVTNIQNAILILGLNQVTNLIKGMSLRKAIGGQELAYEKFWERSNEIATLCSIIANKQISACNVASDQAFMAGLFHECGVPLLMQRFPEYCQKFLINQGSNWPDFEEEDKLFNTDHSVVGYLVTKHWNLPEFICQAVRFHNDSLNVDHAALTLVSILQMARHLHLKIHRIKDKEWPDRMEQVLEEIGVGKEGSVEFMEDVIEIFNLQQT